ncbi:MAG: hypothetical protein ACMVP2_26670 [Imperialibacter sp.]|uniref:hypothetical protein n=1 Tax=Imperialibacter sp. TaxID=2038411 RepID=UPI003A8A6A9D
MSKLKTYRWVIAAAFMWCLAGCEPERLIFKGPYHVRFTEETASELESYSEEIALSVHLVGPQRSEKIQMSYSIAGDAREGIDYEVLSEKGIVEIPANESFGYITIRLINNANNILESQDIIFTLEGVSPVDLAIGQGDSEIGRTLTFTIFDDCILGGYYTGYGPSNTVPIEDIRITSADCNEYFLSNWDINLPIFNSSTERDLIFNDNFDNTLTIPEQEEQTLVEDQATIRGSGIVNPLTGEITLTIEFVDVEDIEPQTVTFKRQ